MSRSAFAGCAAAALAAALNWTGAAQAQEDAACAALGSYTPPPAGTVIRFETRDGDTVLGTSQSHEIGDSAGDRTDWLRYQNTQFDDLLDERPTPRILNTRGGLFVMSSLPGGDFDGDRRYAYEEDPVDLLVSLAPGETAMTERAETSSMNNRTRTIRGPMILTLEGCGTVEVGGVEEPVHFYRMTTDARSYMPGRRPEADTTLTTELVIALSDRLGWPLQYEGPRYTVRAVEITVPDSGDGEGAE